MKRLPFSVMKPRLMQKPSVFSVQAPGQFRRKRKTERAAVVMNATTNAADHPLHKEIGGILKTLEIDVPGCTVILDEACGGSQHIQYLFPGCARSNASRACNGDALVLMNGDRRIEVEVEESDLRPINFMGKAMASRGCQYIDGGKAYQPDERGITVVHIVNTNKPEKISQLRFVEPAVQKILDASGQNFVYVIFYGTVEDFRQEEHRQELLEYLKQVLTA